MEKNSYGKIFTKMRKANYIKSIVWLIYKMVK